MKSALKAFAIIYFLIFVVLLFLFFNKNFGEVSIALIVPLIILPATLLPLFTSYNMLKAEKKSRNL